MREIIIAADQDPATILDDIIDLADEAHVELRELPRGRFDQMATTNAPQGVVALAAPLREYAIEELLRAESASSDRKRRRATDDPSVESEQHIDGGESDADPTDLSESDREDRLAALAAELIGGPDLEDSTEDEPDESDPDDSSALEPSVTDSEPLPELTSGIASAPPLLLVVDGITDPGNLGAILRTAECAGVTGVVLPRHRAARITPTVTKRAAGAVEHLRFAPVSGIPTALATLAGLGVWSVGLDVTADHTVWDLDIADAPLALVLGAEGRGLSRLVRQRCDVTARIPVNGRLDSLNVGAATAVALFEVLRRRTT